MYKCGWNGCEKAYGTLNHLNAHVTMQAHGAKRTPEGKSPLLINPLRFFLSSRILFIAPSPEAHAEQDCDLIDNLMRNLVGNSFSSGLTVFCVLSRWLASNTAKNLTQAANNSQHRYLSGIVKARHSFLFWAFPPPLIAYKSS